MALVRPAQRTSSNFDTSKHCRYHVFLSFRGDTRKTFTDHLYTALVNAGFLTFRDDDELERGEDIKPELQKAIKQSRTFVVVFSKDYASSRWCLDELVMILQRKRISDDHVVLPVFYDVDPSHVRNQTGSIAKAFARHERSQFVNKVNGWREVLAEVADLAGMVLQNQADGCESKFINKIVKVIADKLSRTPLSVAPFMVGMHSRVKDLNLWIRDGSTDVGVLVIYGMSGIGKTTIAKSVYNSNFIRFEGSSFIENVREMSQQYNGLVQIQMQLLYDILNRREVKIHNVSQGIIVIADAISCKKVLVVLDDVDSMVQLDAVLRMKDQFYPGSKIIITTRNASLLKGRQVTKKQEVGTLDYNESLELLSWHAFGQNHPTEGYMDYSAKVVKNHCGGLPLALQVLGSSLSGESIGVWKSALEKLEAIPNGEIMNKLRISYDSLQDGHDQKLFLHIACFFIGKDKDYIGRILDGCDFYTTIGIQNLVDRCLVTIDEYDKVNMHDMIRDMGRGIVRLESEDPGRRSRIWHHKDSRKIMTENNGTQTIEGLVLDKQMHSANNPMNSKVTVLQTIAFTRMQKLKLLRLGHVQLDGCYAEFPTGLRWLNWLEYSLNYIPIDFSLECLIVLEMQHSSLTQVCKGTKRLPSLRILDLSHSHGLTGNTDFLFCPNLEKLILEDCTSLTDVHESIGNLGRLVYLNLKDCKNLRMLPLSMFMLKLLETLFISGCSSLREFPVELMNKMESLKVLKTDGIPISELWPGRSSCILSSLPRSLVKISLIGCNLSDDAFPRDFSNLSSLRRLYLDDNPICSLPNSIKGLTKLDILSFHDCRKLKSLVGLPKAELLTLTGCTSLEKVAYQSIECQQWARWGGNDKLVEWEYMFKLEAIRRVDVEMINLLGLSSLESMAPIQMKRPLWRSETVGLSPVQGLYQGGVFSTFFAGNEVPGQFSHKSRESSLSFTLPLLDNHRIKGLNVFTVYANSGNCSTENDDGDSDDDDDNYLPSPMITKISNKSKRLKWIYGPLCYGTPGEGEDMTWLSHWKMSENEIQGGDELVVSVLMRPWLQVKECGIQLIVHPQPENNNMIISTQDKHITSDPCYPRVIGGDLSNDELIPGIYFLCSLPCATWDIDSYRRNWLNNLIRDSNEDTDEEEEELHDDHTMAETRGSNNCSLLGWKAFIAAAGFLVTLSLIARSSLSQRKKHHSKSPP